MPRGDRTGPMGMGPMSGRGAGYCGGYDAPGAANWGGGRGRGMGRGRGFGGRGRGFGGWFGGAGPLGWARFGGPAAHAAPEPETEKRFLRGQADDLQRELESVKDRLRQLGDDKADE